MHRRGFVFSFFCLGCALVAWVHPHFAKAIDAATPLQDPPQHFLGSGFFGSARIGAAASTDITRFHLEGAALQGSIPLQPTGFTASGSLGYRFSPMHFGSTPWGALRLGLDLDYFLLFLNRKDVPYNKSFKTGSLLGTVAMDFNTGTPIVPYIGLGAGMFLSTKYTNVQYVQEAEWKEGAYGLALQWNAGAKFYINPHLAVDVRYRMDFQRGTFVGVTQGDKEISALGNLLINSVETGVNMQF